MIFNPAKNESAFSAHEIRLLRVGLYFAIRDMNHSLTTPEPAWAIAADKILHYEKIKRQGPSFEDRVARFWVELRISGTDADKLYSAYLVEIYGEDWRDKADQEYRDKIAKGW